MSIRLLNVEMDLNRLPVIVAERELTCHKKIYNESSLIVEMLNSNFRLDKKCEEYVYMVSLDNASHILGVFEISHGGVGRSFSGPREVFQRALLSGASGIVIVHNHTSGRTEPSDIDILLCSRLKKAGEILGISLYDFIIVGEDYYSFTEDDKLSIEVL